MTSVFASVHARHGFGRNGGNICNTLLLLQVGWYLLCQELAISTEFEGKQIFNDTRSLWPDLALDFVLRTESRAFSSSEKSLRRRDDGLARSGR